jgi:hypothetical protein
VNHLIWQQANYAGSVVHYGLWEGAKCFSVFYGDWSKNYNGPRFTIKCNLPGFRPDLPPQVSVETAQAFAEKMLTRWVAKRGLLFKAHIIVTDAMKEAGLSAAWEGANLNASNVEDIIKAALAVRG